MIHQGYSEYWRKNKSILEAQEMAYALRALKKVGHYITTNFKPIEWRGMSDSTEKKIIVNPAFAMGEYPIPPWKMDVLVGYTAHEAFHCKELSDFVWFSIENNKKDLPPNFKKHLQELIDTGEDIYVDCVSEDTIWKYYIIKSWKHLKPKDKIDFSLPPTPWFLFQLWREMALEDELILSLHPDYAEPLELLFTYTDEIKKSKNKGSPLNRCNHRIKLYFDLWEKIFNYFRNWEEDLNNSGNADFPNESGEKQETPESEDAQKDKNTLSQDLSSKIKEILDNEKEEEDLTGEIEKIAGEYKEGVLKTIFTESHAPCRVVANPVLVDRLKRIFQTQKRLRRQTFFKVNRSLYSGKIDGRKLYRVPVDNRVFKQRERQYENNFWNIIILVDASESMKGGVGGAGGKDWWIVQNAFVSLYEAAKSSGNKLDVLCYYEQGGKCEVTRLLHHNRMHTVIPNGRTPTGQAIIAAALKVPRDKKTLIIHITDGEPNCGVTVTEALEYCEKQGIDLVTIGCFYNKEIIEHLQKQYGDKLYLMDSIEELPMGLEKLITKKIL